MKRFAWVQILLAILILAGCHPSHHKNKNKPPIPEDNSSRPFEVCKYPLEHYLSWSGGNPTLEQSIEKLPFQAAFECSQGSDDRSYYSIKQCDGSLSLHSGGGFGGHQETYSTDTGKLTHDERSSTHQIREKRNKEDLQTL